MKKFDLNEAVAKRRIIPFSNAPKLVGKELKAAEEDVKDARDLFSRDRYKSATAIAYYAIFHVARALLYQKKYREKSHIQLAMAVKGLYVDTGQIPQEFYDNFIEALSLREMADYKSKYSKDGAERSIHSAENAIKLVKQILGK